MLDPQWEYRAKHNMMDFKMIENYKLYGKNKLTFGGNVTTIIMMYLYMLIIPNRAVKCCFSSK